MTIKKYLCGLSDKEFDFVLKKMLTKSGGITADDEGCCVGDPPAGLPPTPNGDWECSPDCKWVWVPETE